MRSLIVAVVCTLAAASGAEAADDCGVPMTIAARGHATLRYALTRPASETRDAPVALVLLVGGGGVLNLDERGCPRALARNVLARMLPLFHAAGFVTALVDAPSDFLGEDGLAGFRDTPQHADDLGKVIADLRARTHGPVWVVGHSRGTISAINAAARLAGASAPDGVVLLSAIMSGDARARKSWVAQTVFDPPLAAIKIPLLVAGHAADSCPRSPPRVMDAVIAKTQSGRAQGATVTGGPVPPGRAPTLAACEVGQPHDYVDQDADVAAGIERFVRGGRF